MPITVQWYEEEQKNIQYDVVNIWSWQDLADAIEEAIALLDSVDYKVNLIIDFTNTTYIPPVSIVHLNKVANAPTVNHPNTKKLIMVGANKYIQVIFNVFKKVFPFAAERYEIFSDHKTLDASLYNRSE